MVIKVKKIQDEAKIPNIAYKGDAGADLYAIADIKIKPSERVNIGIGLAMEIPFGYVGLIWDKSGLAAKHGIHTLAGVVDAGYRGEIHVTLLNTSNKSYQIKKGDKIAQILIQAISQPQFVVAERLNETSRGAGTKGSSGK